MDRRTLSKDHVYMDDSLGYRALACRYDPGESTQVGCVILRQPIGCAKNNHFEVKVLDSGKAGRISIGLVPYNYPLDQEPGHQATSIGYHGHDGKLYYSSKRHVGCGPCYRTGDRIGCGVREEPKNGFESPLSPFVVYFTRNGKQIASLTVRRNSVLDFYPAISLHSEGETVEITARPSAVVRISSIDDFMLVDSEEDWIKTHDVRINGQIIEYTGKGEHIHDVGLAQAKYPLSTTYHYFEIEILEPGDKCFIAIGLIHKNYPLHRHPGWNMGSIAYHADDGKIFVGRGQGTAFGPKCYRGDVMGCGIQYPFDYVTPSDDEDEDEEVEQRPMAAPDLNALDPNILGDLLDDMEPIDPLNDDFGGSGDEEDLLWGGNRRFAEAPWAPRVVDGEEPVPMDFVLYPDMGRRYMERWLGGGRGMNERRIFPVDFPPPPPPLRDMDRRPPAIYGHKDGGQGLLVKVFFTRNGRRIGQREVTMPKSGFYPAVGMLSNNEKVKVDLRPLSG
ncbi:unnamed protein product [Clavelina lepadiformis]|uniref:B30.2/SPRY domain-containing protein n=1 Tax=Clavelina lepadiformis TaxID=159417 RepID=A0ABP0F313_CLALP